MKARIAIICIFALACGPLAAQREIPFVKKNDLLRWKNSRADTTYVINFWATWCGPCVEELPAFEKLNRRAAKSGRIRVILVSVDFKRNVQSAVAPFVEKNKLESAVVFLDEPNANRYINDISPDWSGAIPATLFVNGARNYLRFHEGKLSYRALKRLATPR